MAAIHKTEKARLLRALEVHEENDASPKTQRNPAVHDRSHYTERPPSYRTLIQKIVSSKNGTRFTVAVTLRR